MPENIVKSNWTDPNKILLESWAKKAQNYRWLHHKASNRYSFRSQTLTIIISVLSYISGGSALTTNMNTPWLQYFVGYLAILCGILTNINGLVAWKQLSEKHNIASTQYSSLERSISSMLSLEPVQRADPLEFINEKRKEMDEIIKNAPNIPSSIIKLYDKEINKGVLTEGWIIFYSLCCCYRDLRIRLLKEEERTNIQHSNIQALTNKRQPNIYDRLCVGPMTTNPLHEDDENIVVINKARNVVKANTRPSVMGPNSV